MKYKYVDYLWDNNKAAELENDEVALFLYRSNILGADLRITNYGGGNTSCKTIEKDPLTNEDVEVMWVKGYYITRTKLISKINILFLINKLSSYKMRIYNSFRDSIGGK